MLLFNTWYHAVVQHMVSHRCDTAVSDPDNPGETSGFLFGGVVAGTWVALLLLGECKLHVSTFATTRVALLTGVEPGKSTNGNSLSGSEPLFSGWQVTLPCRRE